MAHQLTREPPAGRPQPASRQDQGSRPQRWWTSALPTCPWARHRLPLGSLGNSGPEWHFNKAGYPVFNNHTTSSALLVVHSGDICGTNWRGLSWNGAHCQHAFLVNMKAYRLFHVIDNATSSMPMRQWGRCRCAPAVSPAHISPLIFPKGGAISKFIWTTSAQLLSWLYGPDCTEIFFKSYTKTLIWNEIK